MLIDEKISSYVIIFPHESVINYFKTHYIVQYNVFKTYAVMPRKFYKTNPYKSGLFSLDDRYCDMIHHKLQPN